MRVGKAKPSRTYSWRYPPQYDPILTQKLPDFSTSVEAVNHSASRQGLKEIRRLSWDGQSTKTWHRTSSGGNDLRSGIFLDLGLHVNEAGPTQLASSRLLAAYDDLDLAILDTSDENMHRCLSFGDPPCIVANSLSYLDGGEGYVCINLEPRHLVMLSADASR